MNMNIVTIHFDGRSTKNYDYLLKDGETLPRKGDVLKYVRGYSISGPIFTRITIIDTRVCTALPLHVTTLLEPGKDRTMFPKRLPYCQLAWMRSGCKKPEQTPSIAPVVVQKPVIPTMAEIRQKEMTKRRLEALEEEATRVGREMMIAKYHLEHGWYTTTKEYTQRTYDTASKRLTEIQIAIKNIKED